MVYLLRYFLLVIQFRLVFVNIPENLKSQTPNSNDPKIKTYSITNQFFDFLPLYVFLGKKNLTAKFAE